MNIVCFTAVVLINNCETQCPSKNVLNIYSDERNASSARNGSTCNAYKYTGLLMTFS